MFKCCVDITISASGMVSIEDGVDKKQYIIDNYQLKDIPIRDVYYSNKGNMVHYMITYVSYKEEDIKYNYYDYISDRKKELNANITHQLELIGVNIDDIDINIF